VHTPLTCSTAQHRATQCLCNNFKLLHGVLMAPA
jgi:hypothetical protein